MQVIKRILSAKDPMIPHFGFPAVDVRDVAEMHIRALERPETAGERILSVSSSVWISDLAEAIAEDYPERRISTRRAPNLLVKFLALFDPAIRSIVPTLDKEHPVSNAKAKHLLDMEFREVRQAAKASAEFVAGHM